MTEVNLTTLPILFEHIRYFLWARITSKEYSVKQPTACWLEYKVSAKMTEV